MSEEIYHTINDVLCFRLARMKEKFKNEERESVGCQKDSFVISLTESVPENE
jgi:hypothetical protein